MSHYTKSVWTRETVEITRQEAEALIVQARYHEETQEIDLMERGNNGILWRVCSIPAPEGSDNWTDEALLEHARQHLPEAHHFG